MENCEAVICAPATLHLPTTVRALMSLEKRKKQVPGVRSWCASLSQKQGLLSVDPPEDGGSVFRSCRVTVKSLKSQA